MRLTRRLLKLAPANLAQGERLAAVIVFATNCPASPALLRHTGIYLHIGRRSGIPIKVSLFATTLPRFKTTLRQST